MFAQPDPLPGAQVELPVGHRDRQVRAEKTRLDVSRLKEAETRMVMKLKTVDFINPVKLLALADCDIIGYVKDRITGIKVDQFTT